MKAAEIKEYLKICIELEREADTQRYLISKLSREIGQLTIPNYYRKPELKKEKIDIGLPVVAWLLGTIIILPSAWMIKSGGNWMLHDKGWGWTIGIICIIGVLVGAFCIWFGFAWLLDCISERKQNKAQYEEEQEAYEQALVNDEKRISLEQIRKESLQSDLETMNATLSKTKKCLHEIYNKDVLYSKYRNYACVCSLYEYFDSGRCTRLEGHEGAYNILESEMRLNRIITQTNQILSKLDEIKENQELLYNSIQESNRKADKLLASCQNMSNQLVGIQAQGEELNSRIAQLQTTSDLNLYLNACSTLELDSIRRASRIAQ